MFDEKPILIVEENNFLALDLSEAIEEWDGTVVGPTAMVAEALQLVESLEIAGAIVDCHLDGQDVAPLTSRLAQRGVPFVIHSAIDCPSAISTLHPDVPLLRKPLQPEAVLTCLFDEMRKAGRNGLRLERLLNKISQHP